MPENYIQFIFFNAKRFETEVKMINILIPSCTQTDFFKNSYYPKNITEIKGKPMIQYIIENYNSIEEKKYIFAILQAECDKFHTDSVVSLLAKENCDVVYLKNKTGGALCTCLMAIDSINNTAPLIISNHDQIIDIDFKEVLSFFEAKNSDCGVICFNNVHPRWSYIRIEGGNVTEAIEKKPISHHAIAGFYYFKHGYDFIESAKSVIKKGCELREQYYLSSSINEMILRNKKVHYFEIHTNQYHSFYSPERIKIYEKMEERYADKFIK